jgi:glutamate-1-semialdehyde 2,1-aminomutase
VETLRILAEPGVFEGIEVMAEQLVGGLARGAEEARLPLQTARAGTMFGLFFSDSSVTSWTSAERADRERFARFHRGMLERGVYLAPSQFEAGFLSAGHGEREIEMTAEAAHEVFAGLS